MFANDYEPYTEERMIQMILYNGKYKDLMTECKIVFYDDYFPFMLSTENEKTEIDRFIDESKARTRFLNRYKGNVVVDFSAWSRERSFSECFEAFLYYLADNTDIYNMIFISENYCSKEFVEQLETVFDIQVIELGRNKDKEKQKPRIGFAISEESEVSDDVRG